MPTTHREVHAAVVARVATLLPDHARLPNPYELSLNNTQFLRQGWGVGITPSAENTDRFSCTKKSYRVRYRLAITRKMDALAQDAETRSEADLLLLDDFETILDDVHMNNFNAPSGALVRGSGFDGVDTVYTDAVKDTYRVLYCTIEIEIFNA